MRKRKNKRDRQASEFQEKDLGKDIVKSKSAVIVRRKSRQLPTSILLDPGVITKLRKKANARGIGYQTMLKIIVHEHVDEY